MEKLLILFVVTSFATVGDTDQKTGVYFEEMATPYYAFQDAGYEVEVVSIDGGEVPIDPKSIVEDGEEGENPASVERFLNDADAMGKIQNTASVKDVDEEKYVAVFLPGGHGTMWDLPGNEDLAAIVSDTLEHGGVVGAVCHGPAGLVDAKYSDGTPVVKGRKVSAFTNEEEEAVGLTDTVPFLLESRLEELGAKIVKGENFQPQAVADENLVTGQNPASSEKVAELMLEALKTYRKDLDADIEAAE